MALMRYIARRILYGLIVLVAVSVVSFIIIELPPGDYLTTYISNMEKYGMRVDEETAAGLRKSYGLDQPVYIQYFNWVGKVLQGDLGGSFQYQAPVADLILERLPLTLALSLGSILVIYLIAIPIGILAAVRQYSVWDYPATFIGFIGMAIPEFLLALVLMWFSYRTFGVSIGGLFSPEFQHAAWSFAKVLDLIKHLIVPVIVMSVVGTAGLIRVMRGGLLDEIGKQYLITARAKGLTERRLIMKYAVRSALNPIISAGAWLLPDSFSGGTIIAIVLGIPTVGPMLLQALLAQDMFLASSIVMIISALTIVGILISDIVLALVDPRIRFS
ncbi:MAG: ABC transporter permease [Chloroflexi bacterium]|nr:ABC transporter permease [Chloroflexota bacterium]